MRVMLTHWRQRFADWRWRRLSRVPPGEPSWDELVAEAALWAEQVRRETARRIAREQAMPRPARTVRIVDTSGRSLRLLYVRPHRPSPARPPHSRRPRQARCRRRSHASTTRAGADPPPSEHSSTPGVISGGAAQNIGKVPRVRISQR